MRITFTDNPIVGAGFWAGRLTALGVICRQIGLLFWPAQLSADYSYNAIPLVTGLAGAAAIVFALLLAAIALWSYIRNRRVFFLLLLGLGALLPTSNLLFPIATIRAERFLYVPAIAFAGCLVAALWSLRRRVEPPWMAAALALAGLLFAGRTFARNFDWSNEESLFSSAESAVPESFRPHNAMATFYLRNGRVDEAVREADRSMEILNPLPDELNLPHPYAAAGRAYSDKADLSRAADAAVWRTKALDTLRRGERILDAVNRKYRRDDLAQGRRFQPMELSVLHETLGFVALRNKDFDTSAAALNKAMRISLAPDMFINLATDYVGMNDFRNAQITILEATIWRHDDNAIATHLIRTFNLTAANSCALTASGSSYRLNPNCPLVQTELCAATTRLLPLLDGQGQTADAARVRTAAQHAGCAQ
jgi:tetratricopeptide (TPR) repeat protein